MPTYAYRCADCGHRFETVQSFTDEALTACPVCNGVLRKVFNAVGVVFKGSGFYRTDSRAAALAANGKGDGNGDNKGDGKAATEAKTSGDSGSGDKGTSASSTTASGSKDSSSAGSSNGSSSNGSSSAASDSSSSKSGPKTPTS